MFYNQLEKILFSYIAFSNVQIFVISTNSIKNRFVSMSRINFFCHPCRYVGFCIVYLKGDWDNFFCVLRYNKLGFSTEFSSKFVSQCGLLSIYSHKWYLGKRTTIFCLSRVDRENWFGMFVIAIWSNDLY